MGFLLAIAFVFFSLWAVSKFSAGKTHPKNLFVGAVIIETFAIIFSFIPIPYVTDVILIAAIMFILLKITSIRGGSLIAAALLYVVVRSVFFIVLLETVS